MMGPNYMDDIDCGSFFDHIDDLIDFPSENEAPFGSGSGLGSATGFCDNFPSIWTGASDDLPGSDPLFPSGNSNSASDLSAELAVPYEDIVQLEWLSTFVEDSFSCGGMTINTDNSSSVNNNELLTHSQFQTSSPVSVLESSSSSSCSGGKTMPLSPTHRGPHRARSKRPRPPTFKPRPAMHLNSPTSSITDTPHLLPGPVLSSDSENFAESILMKMPKPAGAEPKKKKKIKLSVPLGPQEINQCQPSQSVRKCMHCEITKTPQWRAGPMGPKTLCNACGVRYKSGRLFPEYRPAASPTFVPALHSNSHKKVVEMRCKGSGKTVMASGGSGSGSNNSVTTPVELVLINEPTADLHVK